MVFTNKGQMYRLLVDNIPEGTNSSKGVAIKGLIEMEDNEEPTLIYSIYRDTDAKYLLFVTKNGMVKKTSLEEYTNTKKKTGIAAINLKEGDSLVSVMLIKDENVILMTDKGYGIRFDSMEVGVTSRATSGVKGINLTEGDWVSAAAALRDPKDKLAIFTKNGLGKKMPLTELPVQKRGGRGLKCCKDEHIPAISLINDSDTLLLVGNNTSICISAAEVPEFARAAAGNSMIKTMNLLSVSKV
jgi:DNA gyrase subunit A